MNNEDRGMDGKENANERTREGITEGISIEAMGGTLNNALVRVFTKPLHSSKASYYALNVM